MERLKNVILAALVLLSLLLSWQLMTYRPQYDYLPQTQYAQLEGIAQKREWQELFRPHLLVFHLSPEEVRGAYPHTFVHDRVVERMKEWEVEPPQPVEADELKEWVALYREGEGLEILFWEDLPLSVLLGLFKQEGEEEAPSSWATVSFRRLLLYQDPRYPDEISLLFIGANHEVFKSRVVNLSMRQLVQLMELGRNLVVLRPLGQGEETPLFGSGQYVNAQPVTMAAETYRYRRIPIHHMLSYLFIDPSLARRIEERGDTILYLHGSRGIKVNRSYSIMNYFHPPLDQPSAVGGGEMVDTERAVQFVNQHKGWDREFLLSRVSRTPSEELTQLEFKEYRGAYPVFAHEHTPPLEKITIDLKPDRVVGYSRSLLERGELISQGEVLLPSGEELEAKLVEAEVDLAAIRHIRLGYRLMLDGLLLKYDPYWVIDFYDQERWFINALEQIGGKGQ